MRFDGVEASSIIDASPGNLNGEVSTGFRLQNSLETVSEFRVDSSNYPAEYGTGTAGQISLQARGPDAADELVGRHDLRALADCRRDPLQ